MRKLLLPILVLLIATLGTPTAALANGSMPWQPGDVVGEPRGALKAVAIEREELAIDLRPLIMGQPAQVTATYQVRNDGPAQSLSLLFVAPSLAQDRLDGEAAFTLVTLDGVQIPSPTLPQAVLPKSWQPPETTPGLAGGQELQYSTSQGTGQALKIDLALPSGRHEMKVSYLAVASAYSGDSPARYWQLGYVLAPARDWASFGGLDVRVELPPGWSAAASPALARSGDALVGSFDALPADALALTAQAPVPPVVELLPVAAVGGIVLCVAIGALVGRWLGRRRRSSAWAVLPALVAGLAWAALIIVAAMIQYLGTVPDEQLAWTYGYGQMMMGLLAAPVALLVGIILTQVVAVVANRRARAVIGLGSGLHGLAGGPT